MSVRQEIKSQLAKLLAEEDLVVEHKNVDTAQFNVETRVLLLPIWEKASNDVYDMLVGHEVGHAKYTPDDFSFEGRIPLAFVNVVEDARIEKLIKRRYPGLAKTFFSAYKELNEQDFFEVIGVDISEMNLADRANLYFKIGNFLTIDFTETEQSIVDDIFKCETFEDTLRVAEKLYEYCKEEEDKKTEEKEQEPADLETPSYDGRPDLGNDDTEYEEEGGEEEEVQAKSSGSEASPISEEQNDEPQVRTAKSLENSIKDLVNEDSKENTYVEIPKLRLDRVIVPNDLIHRRCEEEWAGYDYSQETYEDFEYRWHKTSMAEVDKQFVEFKRSAQKEVNYLVKEFECRKAADNYARTSIANTGILNTKKLHTYRFNEDIFKRINVVPDGKNHGLVFILDWSGSMAHEMLDTCKQLFNLIWFCKKVQIPFEVYAFTHCYPKEERKPLYTRKSGLFCIEDQFSLMNLLTHKVNGKTLEQQMKNIYRIAFGFCHNTLYETPIGLNLSGTPLNETLVALHQLLPQFKSQNKVDKVQCVILTDGEAHPLTYHRTVQRPWEDGPYLGSRGVHADCVIRDRKLGTTYRVPYEYHGFTDVLLKNLRDNFTQMNFIGIRVLANRDANAFIRRYVGWSSEQFDKISKRWRKDKSFSINNSGYHKYFGLSSTALSNDDDFEVDEYATKSQIKRAFVKSLKTKKMNKKVLGEFVELIV